VKYYFRIAGFLQPSFLLLAVLWLVAGYALAAPQKPSDKFRLVHADKLFMSKTYEEQALELSGKVHFFYGDTEFKSDRALILDIKKIARLYGNVVVSNDSLLLVADTLAYYRIPELMNAGGRVTATHSNKQGAYRWMKSDYASYDKARDILTC
jgi:lipopolysaccharide export system protein LptA